MKFMNRIKARLRPRLEVHQIVLFIPISRCCKAKPSVFSYRVLDILIQYIGVLSGYAESGL